MNGNWDWCGWDAVSATCNPDNTCPGPIELIFCREKMHFPQLPDPNGWDVKADGGLCLADDWQCDGTGPVRDIHFWGSWKGDVVGEFVDL